MLQAKDDEFGDTLGRSHDVGRLDGFVGRDHYEVLDLKCPRDQGYVVCSEDIVGYRLEAVGFHHRNVLVGGCVKYGLRSMSGKDLPQHGHIQNVAYYRGVVQLREFGSELTAKPKQIVFRPLEEDKLCWT